MALFASNLCRLCLEPKKSMQPIFYANDETLRLRLSDFLQLEIQEDDGFPPHICDICDEKVNLVYDFKKKCLDNHERIKQALRKQMRAKNEAESRQPNELIVPKEESHCQAKTEDYLVNEENMEDDLVVPVECLYNSQENTSFKVEPSEELLESSSDQNCTGAREASYGEDYCVENGQKCSICGKKFKLLVQLRKHVRSHPEIDSKRVSERKCLVCRETFRSKRQLREHLVKEHIQEKQKTFQCSQCPKMFPNNTCLELHEKMFHRVDLCCGTCGKLFDSKAALQEHGLAHLNDGRHLKCTTCRKYFPSIIELVRHRQQEHC